VSVRSSGAPARACAYTVLRRVFEQGAYADRAFAAEADGLAPRDRALAMRLAYGAIQRRGTLDHFLERLAERPVAALDRPLQTALRLGLYELLYLDGAPDYAVVAEAVELAKAHARAGEGLVNAVLRRAAREGSGALLATLSEETPEQAAVKHSHPEWIARLWWQTLGADDACALMAADNESWELALRANTLVTDAATLAARLPVASHLDDELAEAVVLDGPFDAHASPLWREGAFIAQSRAALMGARGELVAVEANRARAGALARTARRMHADNLTVELANAATWTATGFDRVLVDPPCTGLGTLAARPDLRWRVDADAPARLALEQARILSAGARGLRPGGVLVYSTCTISPIENERLIDAFLDSHPEFGLDGPAGSGGPGPRVTLPHRDRTAGFFIARMRRS